MLFLGCDPGATGALCLLNQKGQLVSLQDWDGPHNVADWLKSFPEERIVGALERVGAMPDQGVSSTFKFGFETGSMTGVLASLAIPYEVVSPKVWQKGLFTHTDGLGKARSIQAARRIVPSSRKLLTLKKHHNRADACLIAHWLWRQFASRGNP